MNKILLWTFIGLIVLGVAYRVNLTGNVISEPGTCVIGPNSAAPDKVTLGKGVTSQASSVCDARISGCGACLQNCASFVKINDLFGCSPCAQDNYCNPLCSSGSDPDCAPPIVCGNDACEGNEDQFSCPQDCGFPSANCCNVVSPPQGLPAGCFADPSVTPSQCASFNGAFASNSVCGTLANGPCIPIGQPFCGNNLIESGEQCEDGNTVSGDGCSSTCQTEQQSINCCIVTSPPQGFPAGCFSGPGLTQSQCQSVNGVIYLDSVCDGNSCTPNN